MKLLQNRTVIVTGSSRGIGRAIAIAFAQEGAQVALNYHAIHELDHDRAQATLKEVQTEDVEAILVEADISQATEVDRLFAETHQHLGSVDILVNNAGLYPRTPWDDLDESTWDRVLDVNLKGAYLCAKAATPDMVHKGYGKIINVTSVTFLLGIHQNLVHYISSKGGIIGLTRALARELGEHNIQVNAVSPGAIQTEAEIELFPDQDELLVYLNERQCLKRRGTPSDIAGTFVFLASHQSDFITGQTINVDGGWAMH